MASAPPSYNADHSSNMTTSGTTVTPTNRSRSSGSGSSRRTLNFYQAMRDFKQMFPTMDEEIIEAVLRANNGEVDPTIDQLLTMNIDMNDHFEPPPPLPEKKKVVDQPPSYDQAMRACLIKQPETLHITDSDSSDDDLLSAGPCTDTDGIDAELVLRAPSPPTTQAPPIPTSSPPVNSKRVADLLSSELSTFDQTVRLGCSPPVVPKRPECSLQRTESVQVRTDTPPDVVPRRSSGPELPPKRYKNRRPYRKWNPPLLGSLPDDFLRLMAPPKSRWGTETRLSPLGRRSTSPNATAHSISPKARSPKQTFRITSLNSIDTCERPAIQHRKGLLEATQTELSGDVIKKRMAENELRRSSLTSNTDPTLAQELEDERLALLLQNEMFLNELQRDEDFMKTLERDRMNATAFEPATPLDLDLDMARHLEYGKDNTAVSPGEFPYTTPAPGAEEDDKNAEFRRQLAQMGQSEFSASKGKFMALAKKFFRKRRKSPRQVLKESSAPSTMNLLEDFDDEEDDEPQEELPIFEPLPTSEDVSTGYRLKITGGHQSNGPSRQSEA